MAIPIIMPIPVSSPPRKCIVVEGKSYCENKNLSKHDIGFISAVILIVLVWFGIWAYLVSQRCLNMDIGVAMVFGIPLIIGIIYGFLL